MYMSLDGLEQGEQAEKIRMLDIDQGEVCTLTSFLLIPGCLISASFQSENLACIFDRYYILILRIRETHRSV